MVTAKFERGDVVEYVHPNFPAQHGCLGIITGRKKSRGQDMWHETGWEVRWVVGDPALYRYRYFAESILRKIAHIELPKEGE